MEGLREKIQDVRLQRKLEILFSSMEPIGSCGPRHLAAGYNLQGERRVPWEQRRARVGIDGAWVGWIGVMEGAAEPSCHVVEGGESRRSSGVEMGEVSRDEMRWGLESFSIFWGPNLPQDMILGCRKASNRTFRFKGGQPNRPAWKTIQIQADSDEPNRP